MTWDPERDGESWTATKTGFVAWIEGRDPVRVRVVMVKFSERETEGGRVRLDLSHLPEREGAARALHADRYGGALWGYRGLIARNADDARLRLADACRKSGREDLAEEAMRGVVVTPAEDLF